MTTLPAPALLTCRPIVPTRVERSLLRLSRAVEAFALSRMRRRAAAPVAAGEAAADARRNAQALGAVGMLPR